MLSLLLAAHIRQEEEDDREDKAGEWDQAYVQVGHRDALIFVIVGEVSLWALADALIFVE